MRYENMVPGRFLRRPNRFIAHVEICGREEICHVKNTGRCKELLKPGARVWCQHWDNPSRKTKYDLIFVQKGRRLICMDSQAPNAAAKEWLLSGGLGRIENLKGEYTHGDSRFDFSFEKDGRRCFLEVKGVTLEQDGVVMFPDAPTQRGAKHLRELCEARAKGYEAYALFVIQMEDCRYFTPNRHTDPAFACALSDAVEAGVEVRAVTCRVTEERMWIHAPVEVRLTPQKM